MIFRVTNLKSFAQDYAHYQPKLESEPLVIKYMEALAGVGKTYQIIRLAHRLALSRERVLIVQPTTRLIDATTRSLHQITPKAHVRAIHNSNVEKKGEVISTVAKHFQQERYHGEVLLITRESFDRVPFLQGKGGWHLIIDGPPGVEECLEWVLPKNYSSIAPLLDMTPTAGDYSILVPKDRTRLREMAENGRDMMWKGLEPHVNMLLSPHWTSYVRLEAFHRFCAEGSHLTTFSIRKSSSVAGFKSATIVGALFTETLLHRIWSRERHPVCS
jgi:hypothetical protein